MSDLLAPPKKPVNITSAVIRQGMLATWNAPEYAIMWEVGDATGARHTRFADAVIMSLWPSRGLELHGVEIKISRSDWRREAADPKKAEAIAKYCDRWYVHTAPGVIQDLAEVPPGWGLREFDGKKWRTVREAARNPEPEPINRTFLAALLRRADESERRSVHEAAERMIAEDRDAYEKRVAAEVERRTRSNSDAAKAVADFEEASGFKLQDMGWFTQDMKQLGRLLNAIKESKVLDHWDGLVGARDAALKAFENLDKALTDVGLPLPEGVDVSRFFTKRKRAA